MFEWTFLGGAQGKRVHRIEGLRFVRTGFQHVELAGGDFRGLEAVNTKTSKKEIFNHGLHEAAEPQPGIFYTDYSDGTAG